MNRVDMVKILEYALVSGLTLFAFFCVIAICSLIIFISTLMQEAKMIGITKLDISTLSKYMQIGVSLSTDNIFDDLDEEVWGFARKHEHVPDFDRTYCVVVCNKLENIIKEQYPNIETNYYIDGNNVHFFVDYQEIKNVTEFKVVVSDFLQKQIQSWIPDLYMALSKTSGIGVKINGNKVEYAYAQDFRFGNVQETELNIEKIDKEDGTGIETTKYFLTHNVGQRINLDNFKKFNKEKYKEEVLSKIKPDEIGDPEKEALYDVLVKSPFQCYFVDFIIKILYNLKYEVQDICPVYSKEKL